MFDIGQRERKIQLKASYYVYVCVHSQMTGSPLSAAKRLQFNLEVVPIPEIEQMSQLQEMMLPLFWVEEGAHLNRTITDPIKNSLFL